MRSGPLCADQRLGVQQGQVLQLATQGELPLHDLAAQPVGPAGALHFGAARHALSAHEDGDSHHAFVAHQRNFTGRAVFQHVDQRDDARDRKVKKIHMITRLRQGPAQGHVDQLQVGQESFKVLRRQRDKDVVLRRIGW
jgi:hypothetical protein